MIARPNCPNFHILFAFLIAISCAGLSGCHRAYYRQQADAEAYAVIDEKVSHTGDPTAIHARIEPSRKSRMFDPFDPDQPPMPEDDPASHRYMHYVDGKRGYPMWHGAGDTNTAESPDWWAYLPLDERGVLVLDADTAVRLALLHSPSYQQQLETLYLSALDVSSERFRFDTQFYGGYQAFFQADGPLRTPTGESSTTVSVGPFSTGPRPLAMQRTFATGAELVVGLANNIVWELSGPNTQSATTVLDFTLVQPLLRGAGRDRVMETLTRSERQLLANVRAMERYRRSFYLNITTGRSTESGPSRSGGVFGVGLGGFTGLGGGFGGIGGGGGGGAGVSTGGGVPQAGGFLGLLQDQLQIQNQEENIARLEENLLLLEDTLRELLTTIPDDQETIPRQRLQVAQARQALLSAQSQLLSRQAGFDSSIDNFLRDLGLPPYICAEIRDPMLEQFQLISPELKQRRNQATQVRTEVGNINSQLLEFGIEVEDPDTGLPQRVTAWTPELGETLDRLRDALDPAFALQQAMAGPDMESVRADLQRLEAAIEDRQRQSQRLMEVYRKERDQICTLLPVAASVDPSLFDTDEVVELVDNLREGIARVEERITAYEQELQGVAENIEGLIDDAARQSGNEPDAELYERLRDEAILATQDLLAAVADDVLTLQLIQARARSESVQLSEIELSPAEAFEIARENRRDWANARASLVDSWRLIEFNADDLESSLDVTFSGDIRNATDNPLDLRANTGRLRVGLQWDAPLTRLQERNTYRQSLIEYQQARRSYYRFEDSIWQLLRGQLRQIRANQINFELQRHAVRIAAEQIDLNEDIRQLREARGMSSGPTAARDIIFALNDLLNAQNGFLNIWVNYEVLRRSLDLDLGTMQMTPDGMWIDPGAIRPDTVGGAALAAAGLGGGVGGALGDCPPVIETHPIDLDPEAPEVIMPGPQPEVPEERDAPAPLLPPQPEVGGPLRDVPLTAPRAASRPASQRERRPELMAVSATEPGRVAQPGGMGRTDRASSERITPGAGAVPRDAARAPRAAPRGYWAPKSPPQQPASTATQRESPLPRKPG